MDLADFETLTRETLPPWRDRELVLTVIEKGGSGRTFVRIVARGLEEPRSLVLMHYSDERSDNLRFASVTDFLQRRGIPAPRIVCRREDLHLLWVEDLGEIDLGNFAASDWETARGPAYEAALESVFLLHRIREEEAPGDLPELELSFDEALYRWEQHYFIDQFVARFVSAAAAEALRQDPGLAALREELATLPRALVHRDFQSTNVMMVGSRACLIDYQGLRWGLPEYDLASLVYDPYTEFRPEEREALVSFYFDLKTRDGAVENEAGFRRRLVQCASQRLMQALGAYGYLSEVKGKRDFLRHIPTALDRLVALGRAEGGLAGLSGMLEGERRGILQAVALAEGRSTGSVALPSG